MAYRSPVCPSSQSLVARILAWTDACLSRHVFLLQVACGSVVPENFLLLTLCCLPTEPENCLFLPRVPGPWNNTVFFCVLQISSWKRLLKFSLTALHLRTQASWVELSWWDGSHGVPFPAPSLSGAHKVKSLLPWGLFLSHKMMFEDQRWPIFGKGHTLNLRFSKSGTKCLHFCSGNPSGMK